MVYQDIPGRPRSSAGFAQYEGRLYWVGGHLGEFHYYGRDHFSRQAHRLDLETGKWSAIASFPVPAQGFRMCGFDGGIFAFGGFVHEGSGEWPVRSQSTVRRYDIATDKWEEVGQLSAPRSSNVLGLVGDKVYLIGGWDGASKPGATEDSPWRSMEGRFHKTIEIFDLSTLKTSEVIPLGVAPRRAFSAVTIGDEITVACGLGERGFFDLKDEVQTFSTKNRRWTVLYQTPTGRFSPGLAWPGHAPLVIGGLYVTADYSEYEEFDTIGTFRPHVGGGWKDLANLSSPRTFAETAVYKDRLIVLGGHSGLWPTSTVETFDANDPGAGQSTPLIQTLKSVDVRHSLG